MGNETLRIDSLNIAQKREIATKGYDAARGKTQPSIWEQFDPTFLAIQGGMGLILQRNEFKHVPITSGLGFKNTAIQANRMRQVNELNNLANQIKLRGGKTPDPILKTLLEKYKNDVSNIRNAGQVSTAQLTNLNKDYAKILHANLKKRHIIQRGLSKYTMKNPAVGGTILRTYKTFRAPMLLGEALQEGTALYEAFTLKDTKNPEQLINWEAGLKQLPKSAGRAAVSGSAFLAGAWAGAKVFGLLGSVIPGVGTFAGGLIGSVIGFACAGVASQLARRAYNSVIPSEMDKARDELIARFMDRNDTSNEIKLAMKKEIDKLDEAFKDPLKTDEDKKDITASKEVLVEMYQAKFGELAELQPAQSQGANSQQPVQQATTATSTAQIYPQQQNYNQANMANFAMMGNLSQDWSMQLPPDVQKRLFNLVG